MKLNYEVRTPHRGNVHGNFFISSFFATDLQKEIETIKRKAKQVASQCTENRSELHQHVLWKIGIFTHACEQLGEIIVRLAHLSILGMRKNSSDLDGN